MTSIVAALLVTAVALGLDACLLRDDATADLLTPGPTRVVQAFVGTLAARRGDSAAQYLAAGHTAGNLRSQAVELRERHGFFHVRDADARREGDQAEVQARIGTTRDGTLERRFSLVRDPRTRSWKISRFEPLD